MKIAQIAPLFESVPPKLYGGTERVVSYLSDALVDLGHEVTLFASGDSITRATLQASWPEALRLDSSIEDCIAPHLLMLEDLLDNAERFDILHFHTGYVPLALFSRQRTPFISTLHGAIGCREEQAVYGRFKQAALVSISDAQRRALPGANWVGTIYHGLPETLLVPRQQARTYLAFMGRITPGKGVDKAIRIAQACGMQLKIAAKIDEVDRDYFRREIKPLFALPHVDYIGEISEAQKADFLSGASALLFPIDWPEPFGLVMIEAMACATPVIAFRCGSVPEVVDDGVTGFIVDDERAAIEAFGRLGELSPAGIRARFVQRFCAQHMAQAYVGRYRQVIATSEAGHALPGLRQGCAAP